MKRTGPAKDIHCQNTVAPPDGKLEGSDLRVEANILANVLSAKPKAVRMKA